ncbi:MAG: cation diffusion facilitator family transporter [Melioribacter sp.]|uniref:cation diffusion facilitator family transporter n=1 Tax=Rosettibacter primus TaxID=3111523 RepID=UPI00247D1ED9|nr:cation diffusion facilitator family transporter [Melioribacter sp.]
MESEISERIIGKRKVAIASAFAAIFLTSLKLIIGLITGSLGILSEALHSGLDLIAAGITYFAVKYSDKPPDEGHNYGHGKIENYSALIETILLFITCIWIIYEAIRRLITKEVEIEVSVWAFAVMITSIIVDLTRSRALSKAAREYNSQALEADALHFSTDIWSSTVVIIGLICAYFNFYYADAIAGLIVSFIVMTVSYRLGKKSFDALIDKAPLGLKEEVVAIVSKIPEVVLSHDIKVRESGPYKFVDINIHVNKSMTIEQAHEISHLVEEAIVSKIKNVKVMVHAEPDNEIDEK